VLGESANPLNRPSSISVKYFIKIEHAQKKIARLGGLFSCSHRLKRVGYYPRNVMSYRFASFFATFRRRTDLGVTFNVAVSGKYDLVFLKAAVDHKSPTAVF